VIELNHTLHPIEDNHILELKRRWFEESHPHVLMDSYVNKATEWFRSTKLNQLDGWDEFPCVDATMGCTHFIEAFVLKHGWEGFQILNHEYAYYGLMGKHGVDPEQLESGKPLIVSLPNWKTGDFPLEWDDMLQICEQRDIDIHIDFAWITTARNINMDLAHPNIKSFAMSMSKYALQWNRVGIRWSRQRTMDSISIFNRYYGDVNTALASCGDFMIENIPRDYGWLTYEEKYNDICSQWNLVPTKLVQVVKKHNEELPYGIASLLY
jgi:hypothetical protein